MNYSILKVKNWPHALLLGTFIHRIFANMNYFLFWTLLCEVLDLQRAAKQTWLGVKNYNVNNFYRQVNNKSSTTQS